MKNELIKYVDDVNVSNNELMIKAVLNRNFKKLFDNDIRLLPYSKDGTHNYYRIMPYVPGKIYSKNDLVWFVDYYLSPKNEREFNEEYEKLKNYATFHEEEIDEYSVNAIKEKYYTTTLYLLRSLKNNNGQFPQREIVNMIPMFDASGWKNENPFGSIYTDYFEDFTSYVLSSQLYNMHEAVKKYHKFGMLSSYTNLDDKVLRTDLLNLNPDRKHVLFPNETYEIEENGTILGGSVRYWDCGLVEYDIEFQLGNSNSTKKVYNADGSLRTVQSLEANYFSLKPKSGFVSEYDYYDNRKYYLNDEDADIFTLDEGTVSITQNGISQGNISDKINVFTGTIDFPIAFKDTNYAVFSEMFPCIVADGDNIVENNVNSLVFANKSRQSITAILVIPTYNGGNPKVLCNNRFRCQICGRWK